MDKVIFLLGAIGSFGAGLYIFLTKRQFGKMGPLYNRIVGIGGMLMGLIMFLTFVFVLNG